MAGLLISIEAYQNIICNKSNYFCDCTNKKNYKRNDWLAVQAKLLGYTEVLFILLPDRPGTPRRYLILN